MSYEVLARKYRPMSFDDLVGQEHVARTLRNAIEAGRVAHAFLFTGVRGVGKTTSARILAKALNCMRPPGSVPSGEDPGPTDEPCLVCSACEEIKLGNDVDVREIDGASYNGVDEVRKLQDTLPYRPTRDRFKIFIVDEVHMLSQAAWNAFLKTLEEPPPHVKFIFATTEVQKVPVTILSRCQRFDFKLIPTRAIATRLGEVLEREGISADEQALSILARDAAGSMRDAMSRLDQVIAWSAGELTGDGVAGVLGVASRQVLHDLVHALIGGRPSDCLRIVATVADQGYDMAHVARDVLSLLRDLVVAKICEDASELIDLADEERADLRELAEKTDTDDVVRLHQGFSAGFDTIVRGAQPRAALEMLLVRLARRPPLIPLDDLVARLAALERRVGGGSAAPAPHGGRSGSGGLERGRGSPKPRDRAREREPRGRARREPEPSRPEEPPPSPEEIESAVPIQRPAARARPGSVDDDAEEAAPTEPGDGQRSKGRLDDWRAIVNEIRQSRPELAAVLGHAAPLEVSPERLLLGFEAGSVWERTAGSEESMQALTAATRRHFRRETEVAFDFDSRSASAIETVAMIDFREREQQKAAQRELAKCHPLVSEIVDILGARLKQVRLPDE